MSQQSHLGRVATNIRVESDKTIVRYHNTDVVTFDSNTIKLNTGGWETATTKTRMNQAARQFNLNYTVYQKNFEWYAVINQEWDKPMPFTGNTLIIPRNTSEIQQAA